MNWDNFFAAFSGSSAALIGVTFAFIVSKLLSNISDSDSLNNETTDLIIERKGILNEISNIAFYWHDKMVIKYGYQIKQKYRQEQITDTQNIIDKIEKETNRRIYLHENSLDYIKSEMAEIDEENKKRQIPTKAIVNGEETTVMITPPDLLGNMPEIPYSPDMWKEVNEEEQKFDNCYQKSEIQIEKFKNVINKINSKIKDFKVIRNIIIAFIPITILTVIYPLHFIPTHTDDMPEISFSIHNFIDLWFSLKGLMLTILFISTVGSMIYFIMLCKKNMNKLNNTKAMIINDYIDINKYSELFNKKNNIKK